MGMGAVCLLCYLLPVEIVKEGAETMGSKKLVLEAWRDSHDKQQDLLEGIFKLMPDQDYAVEALILAYGEECKREARSLMAGGYEDTAQAMKAWSRED